MWLTNHLKWRLTTFLWILFFFCFFFFSLTNYYLRYILSVHSSSSSTATEQIDTWNKNLFQAFSRQIHFINIFHLPDQFFVLFLFIFLLLLLTKSITFLFSIDIDSFIWFDRQTFRFEFETFHIISDLNMGYFKMK